MITLIGKDLAKKGNEFIFYGSVDECENCRFKASCVDSLEKNSKYNNTNCYNFNIFHNITFNNRYTYKC